MSDRDNQDRYDVIQAQEEFDSMLDPRTAALLQEIAGLKEEVKILKEQLNEDHARFD